MYPIKTNKKYDPNNLAKLGSIYTTAYLGNYIAGDTRENVGSHCGVDIVPQKTHDTVFACMDGIVEVASTNGYNGNYVILKHENVPSSAFDGSKTTLYSCCLHLSQFVVKKGDRVTEGQQIGNTGNTGNSFGEHLHFQIDTKDAPFHPFWPYNTAEANAVGGFMQAANAGVGIDKGKKYTINPLVYLDKISSLGASISSTKVAVDIDSLDEMIGSSNNTAPKKDIMDDIDEIVKLDDGQMFFDVPNSYKYATAVNYLSKNGIVKGNNGNFAPDANITRVELLKIVFSVAGTNVTSDPADYFKDVPSGAWYEPYVETAKRLGIVSGYDDGNFGVNNNVTVAEALKITFKTFSINVAVSDPWYNAYRDYAKSNGILIDSYDDPNRNITRGEIASIVYGIKSK
ncbi:MAG: S-layer homology domain-containing protein [Candidatus Gracilibacteria bacterium]|nr:S-layer homology domain-containing protein [Candidatus Gracilibacteria bacterium]